MLLRGGTGLGGIIILGGVLYYTGGGAWMLDRMQQLEPQCYQALTVAGPSISNPVCGTLGTGVKAVTDAADSAGNMIRGVREKFSFGSSSSVHFKNLSELRNSLQQQLAGLSSSTGELQRMIQAGPQQLSGGNLNQQFQRAIDSFTIGQHYASSGDTAQAVPWLQQGAMQPQGFGLMSQLSLADLYRTGGNGVSADPLQSQAYYGLASNSITQLSQSNSPQAQQLLQSLPASPQQVQQEIANAIALVKRGGR